MLLIKVLVTIEGVGRRLDPEFRMIEYAAPFAARVGLQLRSGQLSVNVLHRDADQVTRDLDRVSRRITSAILVAGLVVGGALIAQRAGGELSWILPWIAAACFIAASGIGIATLVSLLRRSR